jgi:hypothetical protein
VKNDFFRGLGGLSALCGKFTRFFEFGIAGKKPAIPEFNGPRRTPCRKQAEITRPLSGRIRGPLWDSPYPHGHPRFYTLERQGAAFRCGIAGLWTVKNDFFEG